MKNIRYLVVLLPFLASCIGDDVIFDAVPEAVRITASVDTLGLGDTFQFEARFTNTIGVTEDQPVNWRSSAPEIVGIDANGLATGIAAGTAEIEAEVSGSEGAVRDVFPVVVGAETSEPTVTSRTGTIKTTSSYLLEGSFTLTQTGSDLSLIIGDDYRASSALPGLYLYLTNNPNSVNGALEIGEVTVFSGEHSYLIPDTGLFDYEYIFYHCKPFNVKVGDGKIDG